MNNKARDEGIKYIIFGAMTTVINILSYLVFTRIGLSYVISNIVAFILSVVFAFITNKLYVFNSRLLNTSIVCKEIITFFLSRLATFFIDTMLLVLLIEEFGVDDFISKCIINIIVIIMNYILSKFFVFKKFS